MEGTEEVQIHSFKVLFDIKEAVKSWNFCQGLDESKGVHL